MDQKAAPKWKRQYVAKIPTLYNCYCLSCSRVCPRDISPTITPSTTLKAHAGHKAQAKARSGIASPGTEGRTIYHFADLHGPKLWLWLKLLHELTRDSYSYWRWLEDEHVSSGMNMTG